LVNSSARFFGKGKPVSKYPVSVTGAEPHVGFPDTAPGLAVVVVFAVLLPGPLQAAVAASAPPRTRTVNAVRRRVARLGPDTG
jgi:hypothetical protein